MEEFKPELGQMFFATNSLDKKCPTYLTDYLKQLDASMRKVKLCYDKYNGNETPFANCAISYDNDTFLAHAYDWNEDNEQEYNFKYKGLKISWYKYLGRSMSCNFIPDEEYCRNMIAECIKSINK